MNIWSIVLLSLLAIATDAQGESDMSLDDYQLATSGDAETLGRVETCADESAACAFFAGGFYRRAGDPGKAEAFYLKALEQDVPNAALALAQLHTDEGNPVSGFAWSQLFLLLGKSPEEVLEGGEERIHPALQLLAMNHRELDDENSAEADRLTRDLLTTWQDRLTVRQAEIETLFERGEMKPVNYNPPRYPSDMASRGQSGWVVVYIEIAQDGRVNDALAVDYSHRSFAKSARRAARRWRFELSGDDETASGLLSQQILFEVNR